jgi:hypothetical protein
MKAPLDDAATEPDGLVRIPPNTDERAIGALLEGLDDPQPIAPARLSGSNLVPRSQYETALLPDVDRRQRRKGAVLGLVLGLAVTLIVGALVVKTVFNGRNADAAAAGTSVSTATATATTTAAAIPAPLPIPTVAPPSAALTDLPVVAPPSAPSASAAAPSTAKRPAHPASSSSPGEPRRGYGLTSDEP